MILKTLPDGEIYTDGLDGVLLRVLSQKMNFRVNCTIADSQGVIMDNGTVTGEWCLRVHDFNPLHWSTFLGAAGMILEKRANLTIGYFASTGKRNLIMSSSYVYYTSKLVWTRPPGRLFTSFEKLFKPFRSILWSCILALFFLSFLVIRYTRSQSEKFQKFVLGPGNTSPCLNISNIFFGGSLHRLPSQNFARFLLAVFFIYCLVIRSSYQGALFNFMQSSSREKGVDSIQDMTKENFTFYVVDSSAEFITESPEVKQKWSILKIILNLLNFQFPLF